MPRSRTRKGKQRTNPAWDFLNKIADGIFGLSPDHDLHQNGFPVWPYRCELCGLEAAFRALLSPGASLWCPRGCGQVFRGLRHRGPLVATPGALRQQAAIFLASHVMIPKDVLIENQEVRRRAYKRAAAKLHPDNLETGNEEEFKKLQKAMEVLEG